MTPDQRAMAIWGGGAGVVLIAGWIWLSSRGDDLAKATADANRLHKSYVSLYHPDKPDAGMPEEEAKQKVMNRVGHQQEALKQAEGALVATLPESCLVEDYNAAMGQARVVLNELQKRGERQGIRIPSLPYDKQTLDQAPKGFGVQLVNLHLVRQAVNACMEAKVDAITVCTVGQPRTDPGGSYARFVCDLEVEVKYDRLLTLLADLRSAHGHGLGLRSLAIDQPRDGGTHRARLGLSLLVANRPLWELKPEDGASAPVAPGAGVVVPASTPSGTAPGGGGRLNKL